MVRREIGWMCAALLVLGAGGCGSGAAADDDDGGGARGSGGSSGTSGSGSETKEPPSCGFSPVSTTRLPGRNVSAARVANGTVYYSHESGVSKTTLGNLSATASESLGPGVTGLYLNDTQFGAFRQTTYPAGELLLFPLAGGEPVAQPTVHRSVIGDWRYSGKTTKLFGYTGYLPFTYFSHDVTTGQEQTFTTTLRSRGVEDLAVGPNALYVALSDYDKLKPTELYRIDKAGGEPQALTSGIPVKLSVWGADASNLYLWVDGGTGMEAYGPALYQMPASGPGPAVKVPNIAPEHYATARLLVTDAATFIDYYDAFQNPYGNFTYRIGPSASDTAAPVKVLGAHACELRSAWAVGKSIFATIEITDSEQWLFELPADVVP